MMIASLAEPAMLMMVFNLSLLAGTTELSAVARFMLNADVGLRVSLALALHRPWSWWRSPKMPGFRWTIRPPPGADHGA